MSSLYTAQLPDAFPEAARESLGTAVTLGPAIADAAQDAFVHAMSRASIVVAVAAVLGGVVAWRYLPARAVGEATALKATEFESVAS